MKWIPKVIKMRINNKATEAGLFTSMIRRHELSAIADRGDIITDEPVKRFW